MSDHDEKEVVISIENISKRFSLNNKAPRRDSLRELLSFRKPPAPAPKTNNRLDGDEFWALRDINFEVYRGETLGLIGANGAGKSTLLKVLSSILQPTTGEFWIKGRVSSLLEVGTGFHPELSGRENVYFNGSLLGMKRSEIDEKYDEIVEFSELADFMETPIKYYSSGMRARLGFSVAVTLDAEVMIVDEALAVGDAAFRAKAMQRMKDTALSGKTVIFVTHSLSFIQESCDRCVLLKDGMVDTIGSPETAIDKYLKIEEETATTHWKASSDQIEGGDRISVAEVKLLVNDKLSRKTSVKYSDTIEAELTFNLDRESETYSVGYALFDDQNRRLWRIGSPKTQSTVRLPVDTSILKPGKYTIRADGDIKNETWMVNPNKTSAKVSFTIADSRDDIWAQRREGVIKPKID